MMIADLIVVASVLLAGAFVVAWIARPELRQWIEMPKHAFQSNVRSYDRARRGRANGVEEGPSV